MIQRRVIQFFLASELVALIMLTLELIFLIGDDLTRLCVQVYNLVFVLLNALHIGKVHFPHLFGVNVQIDHFSDQVLKSQLIAHFLLATPVPAQDFVNIPVEHLFIIVGDVLRGLDLKMSAILLFILCFCFD